VAVEGRKRVTEPKPETVTYEISEHPFLRGLSPGFLESISIGAKPHVYATDEFLLREGEEANHLFLIYSGKVALEVALPDRPRLTIETVGAGDVVGWSWSVAPRRYEHDARALKTTRSIAIDARILRSACEEDPANGYQFITRLLGVVADRLANTRLQLVDQQRG
jgi:CRP-like cAMP-binding protein